MFKDSKKLATKKTQQQLALLHIKWQERKKNIYKQTKKICTTTCFYLVVVTPAGLPEKGHHMTSHPRRTPQRLRFQKHTHFSSIQIIHTILSCQIKKIYGGSLLGFFSLQKKKGTLKPLKSTGKNS